MGLRIIRNIRQLRIREINEKNKERMMGYIKGERHFGKLNNGKWEVSVGGGLHIPRTTIGIFATREDAQLDIAAPDMYEALEAIASCKSVIEGDTVDIANQVLSKVREK